MMAPSNSRLGETMRLILPREHGSWSLALEPLALGLIAAPSAGGAALGAAVLAGFFLRRPVKLVAGGAVGVRRPLALGCAIALALAAATALGIAAALVGPARLWPLLLAVPPGAAFVWLDARGVARAFGAELAGACAFAAVPAGLASAGGWPGMSALALAAVMAGRSVPAVITIRAYLRRQKGEPVAVAPAVSAALAAVVAAALLAGAGRAPWTAPAVMVIFLIRTAALLVWPAPRWSARRVGLVESALGSVLVIVLALSWFR